LIVPPGTEINFFSIEIPSFAIASATSALEIDPNNLSPAPTLEEILISKELSLQK